jgi:hypothetical protein
MGDIRRLVLDVLKPHDPSMRRFASEIADLEGVEGANAVLVENDEEVENIKFTIEGEGFRFDSVEEKVKDLGGSLHSVDEVVCGSKTVEQSDTPQD